jgi:hypothetical protein
MSSSFGYGVWILLAPSVWLMCDIAEPSSMEKQALHALGEGGESHSNSSVVSLDEGSLEMPHVQWGLHL